MAQKATMVVIITEKLIAEGVIKIVNGCGATGYTVSEAGGKGSRNIRSSAKQTIVEGSGNIRIEVITADEELATRIAEEVAAAYFENFSGIAYLQEVTVLRPRKLLGQE